ncbi:inositol hexakisphosphate and diphosphoinositol-pentakisphosphate kinase 1 [Stegostoma tigrinum]|uniref:inositol hexakisphosphate and diphosphoinositol-pentakisphosphate kinase 1 n=1 Tax=Stegostoma tigrinum TaxID=3053191 RepID=UPI00286FD699|nr:inositol hexakisphosphate and diphosphoinositol-pentakisphosphate kinase 1 [Stegostoma tigrinum]
MTTPTSFEGDHLTPTFFVGCEEDEIDDLESNMKAEDLDLYDDENDSDSPPERQILVGICAMAKKSKSKPMTQILERLCKFEYISVVIFNEDVILNEPVENWPVCDCLISFHSKGFPLDKAVAYAKLRNPVLINDLNMQYYIQDRREVYRILQQEGIDLPRYAVLNRDPDRPDECSLVEGDDHVEVNGEIFQKPFVEKPVSAEDHNVYIYYPVSAGGGSQRLFRKIGSRSSVYSPESTVRKTGSYIYEEFMPTDGTDVKVYTVGPDYAHAEARKSPALDGKVERDSEGKEIRYPVMLTAMEKLVARKVCVAFKQTVCGFDLLRANGHSYVCDVNGFSFVKNSMKYYDDCAKILGNIIMRELAPQLHIPWSIPTEAEDIPIVPTTSGTMMELRCVIAIIRHGDRTPKQKMKMEVMHPKMSFRTSCSFEGCSMVPSIYPLETLHNSLSLKQVNEFLTSVSEICGKSHDGTSKELSAMFETMGNSQPTVDEYIPQQVLPSTVTSLSSRPRSENPPWYSSGPSSTVSSAGPSSPNTSDNSPRFSFSDKSSLTPQSSEEQQQSVQPANPNQHPSCNHKDLQLMPTLHNSQGQQVISRSTAAPESYDMSAKSVQIPLSAIGRIQIWLLSTLPGTLAYESSDSTTKPSPPVCF